MNHAYIMRGIPGSGKSTTAHSIASLMGVLTEKEVVDNVTYYLRDGKIFFSHPLY